MFLSPKQNAWAGCLRRRDSDDYEHRRKAEDDARWGRPDRDYYDPRGYDHDPCKEVYSETYDRETRRREEYREEERQREEQEERAHYARMREQQALEESEEYAQAEYYASLAEQEPFVDSPPASPEGHHQT